jgi:hypothetical protein
MEINDKDKVLTNWAFFRFRGWHIWYFQNVLILVTVLFILPNLFLTIIFLWQLGSLLASIMNTFFFIALILDITVVIIISFSFLMEYFDSKHDLSWIVLLLPICGFVWVGLSLIWRFPYYIQGPLNFGFGMKININPAYSLIFIRLEQEPSSLLILITGSLVFLSFLILQDFLFSKKLQLNAQSIDKISFPNIGTFYGGSNVIGTLLFVFYAIFAEPQTVLPDFLHWILILAIIFKLVLTPLLGMVTTRKLVSCSSREYGDTDNEVKTSKLSHRFLGGCRSVTLIPSRRTRHRIYLGTLFLLFFPFSPFFFLNYSPQPYIDGPYIYREASTPEAMDVLRYIEELDLGEITGYDSYIRKRFLKEPWIMTNETLSFYLQKIENATLGNPFTPHPYSLGLTWNVKVLKNETTFLNLTTLVYYWEKGPSIPFSDHEIGYLTWWKDETQFTERFIDDLNRSTFLNYSLPTTWVYLGDFHYYEYSGDLGALGIYLKQVLFLDTNLNLVCFAHTGRWWVS